MFRLLALASSVAAYVNHFNTTDNHYQIALPADPKDSFILAVADFGLAAKSTQTGPCCQTEVADMMRAKRAELEKAGKKLLFVAAGGDNFYWTGLDAKNSAHGIDQWTRWREVYKGLTDVPWLAVAGNHDLGDSDENAICPTAATRHIVVGGQDYAFNQLDEDKGGWRLNGTTNFKFPDFNYLYTINALNFEYFAVDQNNVDITGLGGNPDGHKKVIAACGSEANIKTRLDEIRASGEAMMEAQAKKPAPLKETRNVLVIQHYPGQCEALETLYRKNAPAGEKVDFRCLYGHTHNTICQKDEPTQKGCSHAMVGGGGGCCATDVVNAQSGFGVVSFLPTGGFDLEIFHGTKCVFSPTAEPSEMWPCPWHGQERLDKCGVTDGL